MFDCDLGLAANGNLVLTELVIAAAPISGVPGPIAIDIQAGAESGCVDGRCVPIFRAADCDVANINVDMRMYGKVPIEPRGGPGLRYSLYDGTPFEGTDSICVVR